ncbi:hypothetical protein A2U01_0112385, partial [Trifolium medium]|nr:hypothetical protein [Trifolium medium]
HRESQPSLAHNLNTGVAEGCKVEPDAAHAAVLEVVAVVLLLPVLPLNLQCPPEEYSTEGIQGDRNLIVL